MTTQAEYVNSSDTSPVQPKDTHYFQNGNSGEGTPNQKQPTIMQNPTNTTNDLSETPQEIVAHFEKSLSELTDTKVLSEQDFEIKKQKIQEFLKLDDEYEYSDALESYFVNKANKEIQDLLGGNFDTIVSYKELNKETRRYRNRDDKLKIKSFNDLRHFKNVISPDSPNVIAGYYSLGASHTNRLHTIIKEAHDLFFDSLRNLGSIQAKARDLQKQLEENYKVFQSQSLQDIKNNVTLDSLPSSQVSKTNIQEANNTNALSSDTPPVQPKDSHYFQNGNSDLNQEQPVPKELMDIIMQMKPYHSKKSKSKKTPFDSSDVLAFDELKDIMTDELKKINPNHTLTKQAQAKVESTLDTNIVTKAFKDLNESNALSEETKTAITQSGSKITQEGSQTSISHPVSINDKDFAPLPTPNSPKAVLTQDGYKEFDPQGKTIKEVFIDNDHIVQRDFDANAVIETTTNIGTNETTKQIQIIKPEVTPSIQSDIPSKALLSKDIAKLEDNFIIDASFPQKISFDNNIVAITTLKELQANQTLPTLEQKNILNRYVGWGGLANKLKDNSQSAQVLQSLLTPQEFDSIKHSVLSSYYTPYFVIDAMYKALEKMGLAAINILEPSAGIGNFLGLMPLSIKARANIKAIEKDPITANIAKYLYPKADILNTGFEEFNPIKNSFDLIIGNPPYGNFKVYDKNYKAISNENIHNYFMLKNLDLLRPNGIMAQVVTTNFLDNKSPLIKEAIAKQAKLLLAVRLPQNTFSDTSVATDIIFFQKLASNEIPNESMWTTLKTIPDPMGKNDISLNAYFVENPSHVLGDIGRYGGMYGEDTVGIKANGNTHIQLKALIEKVGENIHIASILPNSVQIRDNVINSTGMTSQYARRNSLVLDNNKLYRKDYEDDKEILHTVEDLDLINKTQEEFDALTDNGKKQKQKQIQNIKTMLPSIFEIRDTLMELKANQLRDDIPKESLDILRAKLNEKYDNFRKKFNIYLSHKTLENAFDGDPTYPHIAALEKDYKVVKGVGSATKADIFSKQTQFPYISPTKANSVLDARNISLQEYNKLDFNRMSQLLDTDIDALRNQFLDEKLGFMDASRNIIEKDEFLSGNIRSKIASFENKELNPYQNQALQALKEVLPKDISIADIQVSLGSNYIPADMYEDFAKSLLGGLDPKVSYTKATNTFDINFVSSQAADTAYGVRGEFKIVKASEVFDAIMNKKHISMGVQNPEPKPDVLGDTALQLSIKNMKESFSNFIVNNFDHAKRLEKIYNEVFNSEVTRVYDGGHLNFIGSNEFIQLRPHQKNAVYRSIVSPTTLLDHTVGTGKTYTMVSSAMELRRLGTANKPMIAVPNHIVGQFSKEFLNLYPNASILATQRFDKRSRQRTLSSIALGDWDAVIVGHSNFSMMPLSKEYEIQFLDSLIRDLISEKLKMIEQGSNITQKHLQKAITNYETKLQKLIDSKKDETVSFEDLGIDAIFIDEAHEFKNLNFATKQRVSGLGNISGSQKATDLFMKTRFLTDQNKKIVFATGTPISNSVAELWTLMRYLDYKNLQNKSIESFDAFSDVFANISSEFEMSVSGKYKQVSRIREYKNTPELLNIYHNFADTITNDMVSSMLKAQGKELNLPQANFISVVSSKSHEQSEYMRAILQRGKAVENKTIDRTQDNMLKITTDAMKASLDMRLINPYAPDFTGSKINQAVNNIFKEYDKTKTDLGTQLVFIDKSTPKNKNSQEKSQVLKLLELAKKGDEEAEQKLTDKGGQEYIESVLNDGFNVYDDIKTNF